MLRSAVDIRDYRTLEETTKIERLKNPNVLKSSPVRSSRTWGTWVSEWWVCSGFQQLTTGAP